MQQESTQQVITGNHTIDTLLAIVGALCTLLTAIAALPLPRGSSLVQFAARLGADLRNVRKPESPTDTSKSTLGLMLFLLAVPGCAFFEESVVPTVEGCAPGREYVIENLEAILDGEKPFETLDRIKREKGEQFVLCTLQRFVAEYAQDAVAARAYLEREALQQ